jgi:uncharacterized protein YjaZ
VRDLTLVTVVCILCACARAGVKIEYYGDKTAFGRTERAAIQRVTTDTVRAVRPLLPMLPPDLIVRVQPGGDVIPETGETGTAALPNLIVWIVDPSRPGGVLRTVETQLRASLFHELHHLARATKLETATLMDHVITEGMATAFERDFAGAAAPWGRYDADVSSSVNELLALPPTARRDHWLYRHPDGRRWVGLKAGTYIVDQAIQRAGRSSADLVSSSTAEVIALAQVTSRP